METGTTPSSHGGNCQRYYCASPNGRRRPRAREPSATGVGNLRTTGFDEHGDRVPDFEAVREPPGEDPPREVVDHGMKVRPGSVEEAHDRGIDVPDQVWLRGPNPDLGSIRMDPQPRTAPS